MRHALIYCLQRRTTTCRLFARRAIFPTLHEYYYFSLRSFSRCTSHDKMDECDNCILCCGSLEHSARPYGRYCSCTNAYYHTSCLGDYLRTDTSVFQCRSCKQPYSVAEYSENSPKYSRHIFVLIFLSIPFFWLPSYAYIGFLLFSTACSSHFSITQIRQQTKKQFVDAEKNAQEWLNAIQHNFFKFVIHDFLFLTFSTLPIVYFGILEHFFSANAQKFIHWVRIDLCQTVMNLRYDVCAEYYQKALENGSGIQKFVFVLVLIKFVLVAAIVVWLCKTIQKRKKLLQAQYVYETAYYLENCDEPDKKKKMLSLHKKGGSVLVARQRQTGSNIPSVTEIVRRTVELPTLVLQTTASITKQKKTYWFPQLHLVAFDKRT